MSGNTVDTTGARAIPVPKPEVMKAAEGSVLNYLTCTAHSVYWSSRAGERCPMCEVERLGGTIERLIREIWEIEASEAGHSVPFEQWKETMMAARIGDGSDD